MGVNNSLHSRTGSVKLAVDYRFIRRLECAFACESLAIEIRQHHVCRLGKKQAVFFFAATADQHRCSARAARAHMAGGFLEQTELGEDPAGQRDFFCKR